MNLRAMMAKHPDMWAVRARVWSKTRASVAIEGMATSVRGRALLAVMMCDDPTPEQEAAMVAVQRVLMPDMADGEDFL